VRLLLHRAPYPVTEETAKRLVLADALHSRRGAMAHVLGVAQTLLVKSGMCLHITQMTSVDNPLPVEVTRVKMVTFRSGVGSKAYALRQMLISARHNKSLLSKEMKTIRGFLIFFSVVMSHYADNDRLTLAKLILYMKQAEAFPFQEESEMDLVRVVPFILGYANDKPKRREVVPTFTHSHSHENEMTKGGLADLLCLSRDMLYILVGSKVDVKSKMDASELQLQDVVLFSGPRLIAETAHIADT